MPKKLNLYDGCYVELIDGTVLGPISKATWSLTYPWRFLDSELGLLSWSDKGFVAKNDNQSKGVSRVLSREEAVAQEIKMETLSLAASVKVFSENVDKIREAFDKFISAAPDRPAIMEALNAFRNGAPLNTDQVKPSVTGVSAAAIYSIVENARSEWHRGNRDMPHPTQHITDRIMQYLTGLSEKESCAEIRPSEKAEGGPSESTDGIALDDPEVRESAPKPTVMPATDDVKAYLEGVIGVVEANSFESMCLWQAHHQTRKWVSTGHGYGPCVGYCDGRPVHLSLMTATIDGHKILFINATSQVVDWKLIDEWLEQNMPRTAFREHAPATVNKTDALNFGNVFPVRHAIAEGSTNG